MSEYTVTINCGTESRSVVSGGSGSLLSIIRGEGVGVHAPCGGNGTCRQCSVMVTGNVRMTDGENRCLDGAEVLACRCAPAGDLSVFVPDTDAKNAPIAASAVDIAPGGNGLGLAVDIGTTTMAAYLYDMASGRCLGTASAMNAQRAYGGNVISRIQYCSENDGGLEELSGLIRRQVAGLAASLCGDLKKIGHISIAANTVMEHIFAGISPASIGVAPFAPLSLFGKELPASDFFGGFSPDCRLYMCPAVSGYVGGDITAGLVSSGALKSEKPIIFIDIGTNGEIALGDKNGFLCCAAAAGPAFEGAEIECGSPAGDGAVSSVGQGLKCTVLGGGEARSICGSGIIDAVAVLLEEGIIDETGRMECEKQPLAGSVYISGKDVRKIQLAKAAVRAGIETLLSARGMKAGDVSECLIAGGFGAYMNIQSACAIGLLPPELLHKSRHVGNSAGAGASMALQPVGRSALDEAAKLCEYLELSSSQKFSANYIEAMMFDEWEDIFGG